MGSTAKEWHLCGHAEESEVADLCIDGHSKTSRPEGLLELVLSAYRDDEVPTIEASIAAL